MQQRVTDMHCFVACCQQQSQSGQGSYTLAGSTPEAGVRLGVVLGGGGGCAPVDASEEKEKERLGAVGPAERPESACMDSPGDSGCSEPLKLLPALPGAPWLKPRLHGGSCWVSSGLCQVV